MISDFPVGEISVLNERVKFLVDTEIINMHGLHRPAKLSRGKVGRLAASLIDLDLRATRSILHACSLCASRLKQPYSHFGVSC